MKSAEFEHNIIGRFQVVDMLGEGGMSIVYRALDPTLDRQVAIKVLKLSPIGRSSTDDAVQTFLSRFKREAHALARLQHPNIVPIIEYGSIDDYYPYLVMPLLSGGTLESKLKPAMPVRQASHLIAPIADALAYAHYVGIIHRDIKPTNILLTENGNPMLADFGIAISPDNDTRSLTATGSFIGTPGYMAPEQWNADAVPQTDIFSLGVVFYELLTGHNPFAADTPQKIMYKQFMTPLPPPRQYVPDLPENVEEALRIALAREPKDRFSSMEIFADLLLQFASGDTGTPVVPVTRIPTMMESSSEIGSESISITGLSASEGKPYYPQGLITAAKGATPVKHNRTYDDVPPAEEFQGSGWRSPAAARLPRTFVKAGGGVLLLVLALFAVWFGAKIFPQMAGVSSQGIIGQTGGETMVSPTLTPDPTISFSPTPPPATETAASAAKAPVPTTDVPMPPSPTPQVVSNKVLWDCSHKPKKSQDGGFYDLNGLYYQAAKLIYEEGLLIECNDRKISSLDLSAYAVVVLAEWSASGQPYTAQEADIFENYVRQGGGLLILADNPDSNQSVRLVADRWGVSVANEPAIGDEISDLSSHPIMQSVYSIKFYFSGGSLRTINSDLVVARSGGQAAVVAIDNQPGRVVIVGDANLFDNRGFEHQDNMLFALNVINWLMYRE